MKKKNSPLLFSIKPHYADLVFQGLKAAELRKQITSYMEDRIVFIYVSSPVKQLRGGFHIGHVWSGPPEEIWDQVSELAAVNKPDFDAYYAGRTIAYALEIINVWEYDTPIGLDTLRNQFKKFVVPQSWRYAKDEEVQSFQEMKRRKTNQLHDTCGNGIKVKAA